MVQPARIRPNSKINGVTYKQIVRGLRALGLNETSRVVVHASLSAFGYVLGGAETVAGALAAVCGVVIAPAFTYQTLLIPKVGPERNGMTYGDDQDQVEFWRPDLPAHRTIGSISNALFKHPAYKRSLHPALSFVGIGREVETILARQTLDSPFAPLAWLADNGGEVLMLGATQRTNTMLHIAEQRTGRPTFVRWALTPEKVVEFKWPGDSSGFEAITPYLTPVAIQGQIGQAKVQRLPAGQLVKIAEDLIRKDPFALLCHDADCERCRDMREKIDDRR